MKLLPPDHWCRLHRAPSGLFKEPLAVVKSQVPASTAAAAKAVGERLEVVTN